MFIDVYYMSIICSELQTLFWRVRREKKRKTEREEEENKTKDEMAANNYWAFIICQVLCWVNYLLSTRCIISLNPLNSFNQMLLFISTFHIKKTEVHTE